MGLGGERGKEEYGHQANDVRIFITHINALVKVSELVILAVVEKPVTDTPRTVVPQCGKPEDGGRGELAGLLGAHQANG